MSFWFLSVFFVPVLFLQLFFILYPCTFPFLTSFHSSSYLSFCLCQLILSLFFACSCYLCIFLPSLIFLLLFISFCIFRSFLFLNLSQFYFPSLFLPLRLFITLHIIFFSLCQPILSLFFACSWFTFCFSSFSFLLTSFCLRLSLTFLTYFPPFSCVASFSTFSVPHLPLIYKTHQLMCRGVTRLRNITRSVYRAASDGRLHCVTDLPVPLEARAIQTDLTDAIDTLNSSLSTPPCTAVLLPVADPLCVCLYVFYIVTWL
jgi:hypothetical protein